MTWAQLALFCAGTFVLGYGWTRFDDWRRQREMTRFREWERRQR